MSCSNNPTIAYRTPNDQFMVKKYSSYALSAPTNPYQNYSNKEFFSTSSTNYSQIDSAYGQKAGSYPTCGKAPLKEGYCACSAGCASFPYDGTAEYGYLGQSGSSYPAPCARKAPPCRALPPGI